MLFLFRGTYSGDLSQVCRHRFLHEGHSVLQPTVWVTRVWYSSSTFLTDVVLQPRKLTCASSCSKCSYCEFSCSQSWVRVMDIYPSEQDFCFWAVSELRWFPCFPCSVAVPWRAWELLVYGLVLFSSAGFSLAMFSVLLSDLFRVIHLPPLKCIEFCAIC